MERLTVFTPTYNRAEYLERLYNSLTKQTNNSFVWLIVDDGSQDETKAYINKVIDEGIIKIKYLYQDNHGKSCAYNHALKYVNTELFTCVDSDDYLSDDAVDSIIKVWEEEKKPSDIGIVALRSCTLINKSKCAASHIHMKLKDMYTKKIIKGDTMLIYLTSYVLKYHFPVFEGEKFVPEAYIYDKLDKEGDLILYDQIIYQGEYLQNGYTSNMARVLLQNPNGYLLFLTQRIKEANNIFEKCKDIIRYIGFGRAVGKQLIKRYQIPNTGLYYFLYPLGELFYLIRYRKYNSK